MHLDEDCPHVSSTYDPYQAHIFPAGADTLRSGYESQQWLVETNGMSETIPVGDQGYIWSPNDSEGHANICAYDDECTGKGDQKWGDMSDGDKLWEAVSNKGGPRPYVWGEDRWS